MGIRRVAAVALSLSIIALGVSGCSFLSPLATEQSYSPSDGVLLTSGPVAWHNAMWVTDDGENAALYGRVSNSSTESQAVTIQIVTGDGTKRTMTFTLGGGDYRDLGETTVIDDLGHQPGATSSVYLQAGTSEGESAYAPVLSGDQPEYASLVPSSPAPSAE